MLKSDLKLRLTLRVAAVAGLCFAVTSAYLLFDADRSAHVRIDRVAAIAAKELELQQSKRDWVKIEGMVFPDLETVAMTALEPGLCIAYRTRSGETLQRLCSGTESGAAEAPAAFTLLYRSLFDPAREAVHPVEARGETIGESVAAMDPATLTAQIWHEISRPLLAMIATLVLLCLLVYAALARALRPTRVIRAGLERIAANDLSARLPPFDLAELSALREVFNRLAEDLERTLAERNALTHRLIAVQDDERKHLARELHDEFGQNLTAIRAVAAAAEQTAAEHCPSLLPECRSIARTTTVMMEALRGALLRLRPPDVEELGLASSLEGLIAGWNGRGRTRFEIELEGDFQSLPLAVGTGLYRIAQEAITNAAKHADATSVTLRLIRRAQEIELRVEDDGHLPDSKPEIRPGLGLLGMRERAVMLGGSLRFTAQGSGSVLCAEIPVAA